MKNWKKVSKEDLDLIKGGIVGKDVGPVTSIFLDGQGGDFVVLLGIGKPGTFGVGLPSGLPDKVENLLVYGQI